MVKKSLIAITVVALLAVTASAGEVKYNIWPGFQPPYEFIPQEFGPDIPVTMDIGYWAEILNQDAEIELERMEGTIHEYYGCTEVEIETNFAAELDCSVTPNGNVPGDYSGTVTPNLIPPGTSLVQLCVQLEDADLSGQPGGIEDVLVAHVTMTIIPQGL